MATGTEIQERSRVLCDELMDADLLAAPYTRAPLTREAFAVNLNRNVVRLWTGEAEIDAHPHKPRRQAVLNIEEGKRTIVRGGISLGFIRPGMKLPEAAELRRRAGQNFGVNIPNAKFTVGKVKKTTERWADRVNLSAEVTATASGTKLSLLVGWDETRQFISALPERVESVQEAHELLRGAAPSQAKRQGEWFFVPISANERLLINDALSNRGDQPFTSDRLEPLSSHHASCLIRVAGERYAVGVIHDTRGTRHAPLILPDWHRVMRNREITMPQGVRRQYWD